MHGVSPQPELCLARCPGSPRSREERCEFDRPVEIAFTSQDRTGREADAQGRQARIVAHEVDEIEGNGTCDVNSVNARALGDFSQRELLVTSRKDPRDRQIDQVVTCFSYLVNRQPDPSDRPGLRRSLPALTCKDPAITFAWRAIAPSADHTAEDQPHALIGKEENT
jgi:hypothetical protein